MACDGSGYVDVVVNPVGGSANSTPCPGCAACMPDDDTDE